MLNRAELISYALDFVSYLMAWSKDIERVILFGSVARGDFDEESDIDIFIDTSNKKLEEKVLKIIENFGQTQKAKNWELKGVRNHFSCIVGKLDSPEWKDLKRGMANNALILYGKFIASPKKTHHYILFSFEQIRPESKRVGIHRALFGFSRRKKRYKGLADKFGIVKIGKGGILVPVEHALALKQLFKGKKVTVKVYDIWTDYSLR